MNVAEFAPPVARLVGIRAVSFGEGKSVLELDVDERHANPMGTLHGGILCDIADLAMGAACWSTLADGESFTTLELKINFLKPVWSGCLAAHARVRKGGRPPRSSSVGKLARRVPPIIVRFPTPIPPTARRVSTRRAKGERHEVDRSRAIRHRSGR